jgi:hypothetical protein
MIEYLEIIVGAGKFCCFQRFGAVAFCSEFENKEKNLDFGEKVFFSIGF